MNRSGKLTPEEITRLCAAMHRSRFGLRYFREEYREAARAYAGNHWSEEGTRTTVPLNLISLYVQIVGRLLVAKNPRVLLSTFDRSLKPTVSAMQAWMNSEIERMHLDRTLQRVVVDALFSIGILKIALANPGDSAAKAWNLPAGQPFAEVVSLDDFVYDLNARSFEEASFIGHRFRIPKVVAEKLYGKKARDLSASDDKPFNEMGDERTKQLGQQYVTGQTDEFEDHIDLWEVYLPRHRIIVTLPEDYLSGGVPSDSEEMVPLAEKPWLGPDCGPYHILGFGFVPDNAMPKAPIQDLIDLHDYTNRSLRKMQRGIDRMKENTLVRSGASEAAGRIQTSSDGDMVPVDDPQSVVTVVYGGQVIQPAMAMATATQNLFSFMGGNLELLGGRSAQSKTATQDEMLNQNAGAGVADLQATTVNFVSECMKALLWYAWHDPVRIMHSTHPLKAMPHMQLRRSVTPEMRQQGRFEDLDIKVDPYSMQHATPQSRMAALNQVVQTMVLPMMPLLQQQGIGIDINALLQKVAVLLDMPDLTEVLTIQEPPQQSAPTGGEAPSMPAQTKRTYERVSRPGRTDQGTDKTTVASLLGHDLGGAQKNGQPQGVGQ